MASELHHFLTDQLNRLPEDHPDRPFLEGMARSISAFVERTNSALVTDLWEGPRHPEQETSLPLTNPDVVLAAPPSGTEHRAESAERERVVLKGRLGKRVRYSTTPKGVRRAEFNLAVAVDEDHTDWHTVLAFRERADRLEAANAKQGQYVEVIGYRQTEARRTKDGQPKTVERIIAAHIRLR